MAYEGLTKTIIENMKLANPQQTETAEQRKQRLAIVADCIQRNPWSKAYQNLTKQCELQKVAPKVAEELKEIAPNEGKPEYYEDARRIFVNHYNASAEEVAALVDNLKKHNESLADETSNG